MMVPVVAVLEFSFDSVEVNAVFSLRKKPGQLRPGLNSLVMVYGVAT